MARRDLDGFALEGTADVFMGNIDDALDRELPTGLDDAQLHILKLVSLCLASISVASAIVAFYWFIRIRRSFRHDLIMLLIQSDMFKALWFMIFPIVDFTHGPVKSSSAFCQISGFFLSVGIEASDIAVLLIAIHTALYIFRPRGTRGEYGLYPYRRAAFAVFFIVPHLLASLAFINKPHGYENAGEFCYLPVKPSWARMALSWIPRYVIFLTILGTYACIYFYVMYLIRRFGRLSPPTEQPQRRSTVPPTPPIAHHGLVPSATQEPGDRERQNSASTMGSLKLDTTRRDWAQPTPSSRRPDGQAGGIDWKWSDFGGGNVARPSHDDGDASPRTTTPRTPSLSLQEPPPLRTREAESPEPLTEIPPDLVSTRPTWSRLGRKSERVARPRMGSFVSIFSVLRQGPPRASDSSSASYLLSHGAAASLDGPTHNMAKTRLKIRRQLRLLFIYPLVYLVIWVVPFVSHVLNWDDPADPGPFGVLVVSLASLCIQGAVNSWLFSTREKPWQHRRRTGGWGWNGGVNSRGTGGRTHEEMLVDGRIARRRRAVEIEERRREDDGQQPRANRHWWDVLDVDAGMESSDEESLL